MNPLTLVKRIQNINSKEASLGISDYASWHANYKESAYVFVGGIPFDLTEGDLLAVFAQYGEIVDVNLVRDKGTGKSKGFAFIAYEDQRSTVLAVDNLNGAQVLGRTIRVDHVTDYKKKEEEDEETRLRKREERGVCRAFQKGECTRGDGCKFSHDEQRTANTGGGPQDRSSRWGHEKYEGNKEGFTQDNKDSSSRATSSGRALERRPNQSEGREEKRSRRHDDREKPVDDHSRREEKRSMWRDGNNHKHNSMEDRSNREERRSRRHTNEESNNKLGDQYRNKEMSRRHGGDDELEPRSAENHDKRDGKRSTICESEFYLREDRHRSKVEKSSSRHRD